MSHEVKIHQIQTSILRELLFLPEARFTDLKNKTELESDHFKFHIAKLLDSGYIEKNDSGNYVLTVLGKEYANKLDTDRNTIERQPKSAVIIVLQDGDKLLVQERLKHPYFGFWGYPGGKIRWGETIIQAAQRELLEETGLTATIVYKGVYHELVKSVETGEIIEDKIFHVVNARQPKGAMFEVFEGGRNQWMTVDELALVEKKYTSTDLETSVGIGQETFIEATQIYSQEEF
ncbi:MAG: NUDIX hydrolase [Candidatus Microsaccharimonas sp.]